MGDTEAPGTIAAVRAGVGRHQHVHRHADQTGGSAQRPQASRQQRFLVMRGDHGPGRLDHTRPVARATETGSPSVRV
jgi:hypothetical protein